ncbi:polysaccharide pyruvyl transferase family protein [Streptomyces gobiensis]|uniref:polysaccharide pyruvyl transferase family protein n=1 Tax=Streptomyces gobiensis TaxID=2875706 RepID=UPI001E370FB8|nr:polysaccharide pyruvyl transferase family protein [Streptomyces gobiensis]UGY91607.1 polysaccharide pyruvyl transferase family protein [Streptomyces gobiensis]
MAAQGHKALLTGWFSFRHGEITAGDALALCHVQKRLDDARIAYDTAWSPAFRPGGLSLDDADPDDYTHLFFVCGPLHGRQVADLHQRFPHATRIAVGTSTIDPDDPAVSGFHRVLARDAPGGGPRLDLAAAAPPQALVPVVGVILTHGQSEYGARRRHSAVTSAVTGWLAGKDCARLELDTRLDAQDWRHCATPGQFLAAVGRTDLVVTDRLHGLVLALRAGVPAIAVDPVSGGAKVSAQAHACRWPALVPAECVDGADLEHWWSWCRGPGRELAELRSQQFAVANGH